MRKKSGRIALLGSLIAAGTLGLGATAAQAGTITAGNASGDPGTTVSVTATLSTDGAMIAGTQNDITFDADTPVAAKANGKPDCAVNADIMKGGTSFGFLPSGCAATNSCTGVRALVLALDNTDPIPDGSVLYTCNVAISTAASGGDHSLVVSGVILSDPNGGKVTPANGANGTITVSGAAVPSATPTTAVAACPTPQPAPAGPAVWIPDQEGTAGSSATISAQLATAGNMIAGTQNDITFPTNAPIAAKANGKPDCAVNADIMKGGTSFGFLPSGCAATNSCTGVRALVLALDNTDPIPDGSVLYTCNVAVGAGASGTLEYAVTGVILSDPNGGKVTPASGQNGSICIPGPVGPTPTPTEMIVIPTPTATAPPTATPTTMIVLPSATPSPTRTPVLTNFSDEDGCQIGTVGGSSSAWLLLVPAIGLILRRRRSR